MDQQAIERLKASHHVALEAWRETIVGRPTGNAEYSHMVDIEAQLKRAGVYVVYTMDGVEYEGGES